MNYKNSANESHEVNGAVAAVPIGTAYQVNDRITNPEKFTRKDLHLAGVYWPILMQVAKTNQGRCVSDFILIQYAKLIETAQSTHPDDQVVENAIPTSIGRTLDPINWFCRQNELPNLSCLAVDAKGKPGIGYMRNNNWENEMAAVAAHNWANCNVQFTGALKAHIEVLAVKEAAATKAKGQTKKRKITDVTAREMLSKWWYANPDDFPKISDYQRTDMIRLIRDGMPVPEAIATVLACKS